MSRRRDGRGRNSSDNDDDGRALPPRSHRGGGGRSNRGRRYDDDDWSPPKSSVRSVSRGDSRLSSTPSSSFAIGDRVEGNFEGSGNWYPGKIRNVNRDGSYNIAYDDGDSEKFVHHRRVRSAEDAEDMPSEGPVHEYGCENAGCPYKGTFEAVSRHEKFCTYAQPIEKGTENENGGSGDGDNSDGDADKSTGLVVGRKVSVNYNGTGRWYPGRIKVARRNGTYDIDYDDGDFAARVHGEDIKAIDSPGKNCASKNRTNKAKEKMMMNSFATAMTESSSDEDILPPSSFATSSSPKSSKGRLSQEPDEAAVVAVREEDEVDDDGFEEAQYGCENPGCPFKGNYGDVVKHEAVCPLAPGGSDDGSEVIEKNRNNSDEGEEEFPVPRVTTTSASPPRSSSTDADVASLGKTALRNMMSPFPVKRRKNSARRGDNDDEFDSNFPSAGDDKQTSNGKDAMDGDRRQLERRISMASSASQSQLAFEAADEDASGTLTFDEFQAWYEASSKTSAQEKAAAAATAAAKASDKLSMQLDALSASLRNTERERDLLEAQLRDKVAAADAAERKLESVEAGLTAAKAEIAVLQAGHAGAGESEGIGGRHGETKASDIDIELPPELSSKAAARLDGAGATAGANAEAAAAKHAELLASHATKLSEVERAYKTQLEALQLRLKVSEAANVASAASNEAASAKHEAEMENIRQAAIAHHNKMKGKITSLRANLRAQRDETGPLMAAAKLEFKRLEAERDALQDKVDAARKELFDLRLSLSTGGEDKQSAVGKHLLSPAMAAADTSAVALLMQEMDTLRREKHEALAQLHKIHGEATLQPIEIKLELETLRKALEKEKKRSKQLRHLLEVERNKEEDDDGEEDEIISPRTRGGAGRGKKKMRRGAATSSAKRSGRGRGLP